MTLPTGTGGTLSSLAGLGRDTIMGMLRGPSLASLWSSFTGEQILSDLRDMGAGIRTQDFYDLRREVLGLNKWQDAIKALRNDTLIPRAYMVERKEIDFSSQAQYRFDVTYQDEDTGEIVETVRAISSDRQYTKTELYDQFTSLFGEGMNEYGLTLMTFDLKAVWTRPDAYLTR